MDDTTGRLNGSGAYDEDPDVRTREIREEIAQTRVEMSETIEAIQERLTPGNLAAQAGETVRNAATEKVKQMAHTAEHAAEQLRDNSVVETIRANPIPSAMIGIGAAWLLLKGRSQDQRTARFGEYGRYRTGSGRDWRAGAGMESGSSAHAAVGTSGSSETTGEYGTEYGGYGTSYTGRDAGRVPEFGGELRSYDRSNQHSSMSGMSGVSVDRVVRENPLAIGAAAALVGVAIGLSLPSTETENRVMGETRDSVVDKARSAAEVAADKVKDAVGLEGGESRGSNISASGGAPSSFSGSGINRSSDIGGSSGLGNSEAGSSDIGGSTTGTTRSGGSTRTRRT